MPLPRSRPLAPRTPMRTGFAFLLILASGVVRAGDDASPARLEGTQALTIEGDISDRMIAGVDKFLLAELAASIDKRAEKWKRDASSASAYAASVEPNRQ